MEIAGKRLGDLFLEWCAAHETRTYEPAPRRVVFLGVAVVGLLGALLLANWGWAGKVILIPALMVTGSRFLIHYRLAVRSPRFRGTVISCTQEAVCGPPIGVLDSIFGVTPERSRRPVPVLAVQLRIEATPPLEGSFLIPMSECPLMTISPGSRIELVCPGQHKDGKLIVERVRLLTA